MPLAVAGMLLAVPMLVSADVINPDGDTVAPANQGTVNLGNVSPGASLSPAASFQLACSNNKHVDSGQTANLSYDAGASTVPAGGSLNATSASIGAIPVAWPDDATGSPNCGSTPPTPLDDNGNSTVSITAPMVPGPYTYVVAYSTQLSPAGSNDPASVTGAVVLTYNLTVVVPPDAIAPTASPTQSPPANGNGWNNADVTVTWNWTDNVGGSGIDPLNCTTSSTSTGEGNPITMSATCKDLAGNTGTAYYYPKVDKTAPTVTVTPDRGADSGTWYNAPVDFDTAGTDGLSGVNDANCTAIQNYTGPDGTGLTVNGSCTDNAGNVGNGTSAAFDFDNTNPSVLVTPARGPDLAGWYNAPVVFNTAGTDATSGLIDTNCSVDLNYTSPDGTGLTVNGSCTDNAGNVGNGTSAAFDFDNTNPGITWIGGPADGGSYVFASVPAAPTCTATDATSGPGACTVSGYSALVGTHTMTATAYDVAGNSSSEDRTYTVEAWTLNGFYQPVDMGTDVWNTVKAGSTVPLKFEIFAGDTELTNVSAVASLTAVSLSCYNGTEDAIEITATGSTALRYDATAGQFIYNWKTPTPKLCYRVTMTTQDGSTLVANFKLK